MPLFMLARAMRARTEAISVMKANCQNLISDSEVLADLTTGDHRQK
jgi:hypothetical protein